jgi:hypothetical protein
MLSASRLGRPLSPRRFLVLISVVKRLSRRRGHNKYIGGQAGGGGVGGLVVDNVTVISSQKFDPTLLGSHAPNDPTAIQFCLLFQLYIVSRIFRGVTIRRVLDWMIGFIALA